MFYILQNIKYHTPKQNTDLYGLRTRRQETEGKQQTSQLATNGK